jgi:hypothetical protein
VICRSLALVGGHRQNSGRRIVSVICGESEMRSGAASTLCCPTAIPSNRCLVASFEDRGCIKKLSIHNFFIA